MNFKISEFKLNMASQLYAQSSKVATQLFALPFMLSIWGAERYGVWLLLMALPTWISMADLGFAQVSGNEMTIFNAQNNKDKVKETNQTAWIFNFSICLILSFLILVVAAVVDIADFLNVNSYGANLNTAFIGASFLSIASVLFGVCCSAYRAQGILWLGTFTNSSVNLLSQILLIALAYFSFNFTEIIYILLIVKLILLSLVHLLFLKRFSIYMPSFTKPNFDEVKRIVPLSFYYMLHSLNNFISIQATDILVGSILGSKYVVYTTSIRTFTRVGKMGVSIFNFSLEPIFSRLHGSDEGDKAANIKRKLLYTSLSLAALYLLFNLFVGIDLLEYWTRGEVAGSEGRYLLLLFAGAIAIEMVWSSMQTPYLSLNKHASFSVFIFALYSVMYLVNYLFLDSEGVVLIGYTGVVASVLILFFTIFKTRELNSNLTSQSAQSILDKQ